MVFIIYEVFFVAKIFGSWLVYKPFRNRQTSASRVGNVAGSKSFDKEELGKRGSSREVQLISIVESL